MKLLALLLMLVRGVASWDTLSSSSSFLLDVLESITYFQQQQIENLPLFLGVSLVHCYVENISLATAVDDTNLSHSDG